MHGIRLARSVIADDLDALELAVGHMRIPPVNEKEPAW
jgi:hypothetical protein